MNTSCFLYIIKHAAHEIGHYFVTPPQRRKMVDFGIPLVSIFHSRQKRHERKYVIEEMKARLIEQRIINILGFKKQLYLEYNNILRPNEEKLVKAWWKSDGEKIVQKFMSVK
jgi:elongation factor P hydroxylase